MIFVPVDYQRANPYVYKLFLTLFYIDLFLALCPAWRGSFILKFISYDLFMSLWLYVGLFSSIILSFFILIIQRKVYNILLFFTIYFLHIFFAISIVYNGFKSGGLALFGIPLSYWVLFDTLKQYSFSSVHLKRAYYALLLWCILPIFYYIIAPAETKLLFVTGAGGNLLTFGGFAQHRNFYGILLGITFICTIVWKMKPIYKTILCLLLLSGLILSVCRTAIFSIAITSLYILLFSKEITFKKKFFLLLALIIVAGIIYFLLINSDFVTRDISDNDDRIELWSGMLEIIKNNVFLGLGEEAIYYSKGFPDGAPAHNFILAAIASYGIFVFILFVMLLILVYKFSGFYFRTSLVYLICWGLTQPYFGCTLVSIHIFLPLFIGYLLDNNRYKLVS